MADLRATKRNPLLGLLADAFTPVADYLSTSTNPVEDSGSDWSVTGLLGDTIKPFANTVNRMSYGEPLTTGRGMATQLRPDTRDALLGLLPMGPPSKNVLKAAKPLARDFVGTVGARNMSKMPMAKGQIGGIAKNGWGQELKINTPFEVNKEKKQTAVNAIKEWIEKGKPKENYFDSQSWFKARDAIKDFDSDYQGLPDLVYWRATNTPEEFDLVKKGTAINSKNWAEGNYEGGMSVTDHLGYANNYGYKYVYPVEGNFVKYGSDGEPVINMTDVFSDRIFTREEALNADKARLLSRDKALKELAKDAGIDPYFLDRFIYD